MMKYDDLTLMKFADGELESDLAKEIEIEILHDEELKARLEVFTSTNSLLSMYASEEVPSHIIDLIDNFESSNNKNWLATLFINIKNKYKARTAVISTIFATLIWFSLPPLVITRAVDFDSSAWSVILKFVLSYRGFFWG